MRIQATFIVFFLACSLPAYARVIKVPETFSKIQDAINDAKRGDVILVSAGTYMENIKLKSGVTLQSEGTEQERHEFISARRTTIKADLTKTEPIVKGADYGVIDGFTITGLNRKEDGRFYAVENKGKSTIIKNNIIAKNDVIGIGNYNDDKRQSSPIIIHNLIYENKGLGISNSNASSASIVNNEVFSNIGIGIGSRDNASPMIRDNVIYNNSFLGIGARDGGNPTIIGNRIYKNGLKAPDDGKKPVLGNGISFFYGKSPLISGNIIYQNKAEGIALLGSTIARIVDNEIYDNFGGIYLNKVHSGTVMSNYIYDNKEYGVYLDSKCSISIIGNRIVRNKSGNNIKNTGKNTVYMTDNVVLR